MIEGDRDYLLGPTSESADLESTKSAVALGRALFERLQQLSHEHDAQLIVSTTGWQAPPEEATLEPTQAFLADAGELFAALDVPFVDPSPAVWEQRSLAPEQYVILNEGHPNAAGAALMVEHISPFVEAQLRDYCKETALCQND